VHFSDGSGVTGNGVASTCKFLCGYNNTPTSVTGAFDGSGVAGTCTSLLALKLLELVVLLEQVCPFVVIITLQLQLLVIIRWISNTGTDDNSTKGTRTLL